ncbi:MAG TPA: hypothetical protein P5567_10140 [Kiritimatiellia bacterium]|nr:hypothetical protein [Kiritimatiellia bacterium]HRZ12800.1 hypothetical protein [Kiritimatiellia bacterium]HSA18248.1 hypothetical protein [Kiritimatiellia bacterium]
MDKVQRLLEQLRPWQAERLDGSARGSGLNAVWKIRLPAGPAILKTFSRRRGRAQTLLTEINHRLGGLTSFTARGRRRTEAAILALWRDADLDAPRLLDDPPGLALALPHLCMEFVDGELLSHRLADESRPLAERDALLVRFLRAWSDRHALADERRYPRLIQEHGSFEHVMVAGDRLVTFDLEVSFQRSRDVRACIVAEIVGYVRSLFRLLPAPLAGHYLGVVVREYPRREYLEEVPRRLLRHPNPVLRAIHFLDRRLLRKPGKWHKYRVAELLMSELKMR